MECHVRGFEGASNDEISSYCGKLVLQLFNFPRGFHHRVASWLTG